MSAKSRVTMLAVLAMGLLASSTAFADVPPPKPPEPPSEDVTAPQQPSSDNPPAAVPSDAQTKEQAEFAAKEALAKSLVKRDGVIALPGGQANVSIAEALPISIRRTRKNC